MTTFMRQGKAVALIMAILWSWMKLTEVVSSVRALKIQPIRSMAISTLSRNCEANASPFFCWILPMLRPLQLAMLQNLQMLQQQKNKIDRII